MRTTLTLDEDVSAKLKQEMRRAGKSFKETVNETLRLGLLARKDAGRAGRFVVEARPLGLRPGLSYDNIQELLDWAEGPLRR